MKLSETPEYKDLPLRIRWAIDDLLHAGQEIRAEKENLNKQLETLTNFQPAQKLIPYPNRPKVWDKDGYNAFNYQGGNYYDKNTDYKPVTTIEKLQNFIKENEDIYNKNTIICKDNEKAKNIAFAFMYKLGLQKEKYDYVGRSKTKKNVICDWVVELEKLFVISCSYLYQENKKWAENEINAIKKYESYKTNLKKQIEQQKENELKNQIKTALIVKIIEKYKLVFNEPIPYVNNVIEELAKKDKYLYLAYKMSQNRGDWSDGHSYADTGLDYFVSCSNKIQQDTDVYEEVSAAITNWDGDGRVFRDLPCYNYDKLFSMVAEQNPELSKDFNELVDYKEY